MINYQKLTRKTLTKILREYQVNSDDWNHEQGNKTIDELVEELKNGESKLEIIKGELTRLVRVSSIDVRFKLGTQYFQLVEDKQILFSGAVKKRDLSTITEKVKADEDFLTGAYRGLEEEIGLEIETGLKFIEETNFQRYSPHYPNLNSHYQVFNYQLILREKELGLIRFSEYVPQEKRISLFTLIKLCQK